MNIQFIIHKGEAYVLEVNPRASRTVPFLSKITGIEMTQVATQVILGKSLKELGFESGLYQESKQVHVKAPVFSFSKLADVDSFLGPEMKSTGEVMGSDFNFEKALYKAFAGANMLLPECGRVLFTIEDKDKTLFFRLRKDLQRSGIVFLQPKARPNSCVKTGCMRRKFLRLAKKIQMILQLSNF